MRESHYLVLKLSGSVPTCDSHLLCLSTVCTYSMSIAESCSAFGPVGLSGKASAASEHGSLCLQGSCKQLRRGSELGQSSDFGICDLSRSCMRSAQPTDLQGVAERRPNHGLMNLPSLPRSLQTA